MWRRQQQQPKNHVPRNSFEQMRKCCGYSLTVCMAHWMTLNFKKKSPPCRAKEYANHIFLAKEGGWILISSSFSLFSFCEKIIDIAAKVFYIIQSAGYWKNGDSTFPCNESAFPWRRSITIFFFSASFWMFVFVMSRSFYYCKPSNGQDVGKRTTSTARV